MKLSLIIPARNVDDPKLKELLRSIDEQDFDKSEMEVLVITEGTSESAKAIGIRRAKGDVIGILASDNQLVEKDDLSKFYKGAEVYGASYPGHYTHVKNDDVLNRYFALIGGNDPLSFYMGKNDRLPYCSNADVVSNATFGDNGYFVRKHLIEKTDLDNYYHIDNANEIPFGLTKMFLDRSVWHKTGGNIFSFFAKRYRYGLQHAFNKNRRWHLVDFQQPKDIMRLIWFIVCTLSVIQPFYVSFIGWRSIRDKAWFLHPIVCLMTLVTYSILIIHLVLRRLYQSLFVHMEESIA